ncbi:hypothetical protein EI94DRAFT_1921041 [Lactarius quietus]|nr:hypothetical protein EI94DRAFT_1921041 [Lactarius quietus]
MRTEISLQLTEFYRGQFANQTTLGQIGADTPKCKPCLFNRREGITLLSYQLNMLRIPFPSAGTENITLFRGGKRARRDALKNVTNSVPIVTILKRPSPTPPALQPSAPAPAPPPVKILMNPKRLAALARGTPTPPLQNPLPAPIPAPKARSAAHVSFALVLPPDHSPRRRGGVRAVLSASRTFRPERMVRLPKVIIHEPVWWDNWTDVHHPGTSYGEMLDVPSLNWRGKLDVEDLVRFFPEERSAEQTKQRLRSLERNRTSSRRAAARRHGFQKAGRARSRASPATPPRSGSATCPASPPQSFFFL